MAGTITKTERCAVVTGGNKGIGFEICRKLASNGIKVILTARNEERGIQAVQKLQLSGASNVIFHQLDVKDPASIATLAKFLETNFTKIDILVNNAAESGCVIDYVAFRAFKDGKGFTIDIDKNAHLLTGIIEQNYELAEECLNTNYYGTKRVTEALLPLLQRSHSPRVVNVSTGYGQLSLIYNENVKAELDKIESLTEEKIDEIIQWFLKDFKEDKLQANGWTIIVAAYRVSKVAMNAYTRLVARKFPNMLVNCADPGYVKTDITSNTGYLTPEEGAATPVMVALLPDGGPSGLYFSNLQPSAF